MSFKTIIIVIVSKTNYNICQDEVIFERRENPTFRFKKIHFLPLHSYQKLGTIASSIDKCLIWLFQTFK